MIGIQDFLQSLADPDSVDTLDSSIDTIKPSSEAVTVNETITRNLDKNPANETVTTVETITRVNVTPPFNWGVTGTKQGKWNESEWG